MVQLKLDKSLFDIRMLCGFNSCMVQLKSPTGAGNGAPPSSFNSCMVQLKFIIVANKLCY